MKPRKFLEITPVDPGNIADTNNIVKVYNPVDFKAYIENLPSNKVLFELLYEGKPGEVTYHIGSYYIAVSDVDDANYEMIANEA